MDNDALKIEIVEILNRVIERLDRIKIEDLTIIQKLGKYDSFSEMFGNIFDQEQYLEYVDDINEIDLKELNKKLNLLQMVIVEYKEKCVVSWSSYNNSFKKHLRTQLIELENELNKYHPYTFGTDEPKLLISECCNFSNAILNINTKKDLLEYFSYIDKNYIIFGKNGAGKTRLLKYIKEHYFSSNSYVIPSDRDIKVGKLDNLRMDYRSRYPLSNLFKSDIVYTNDILTLMLRDRIFDELQNENTTILLDDGIRMSKTQYEFIEIFNNLGLDRKVKLDGDKLMLYNDELNISPYYILNGSDGEKSIVQFILFILLCPKDSFVFIDEPESHFNTALLNELFSSLEKKRNDIVFIYCTHNVDFIELREDARLVYLEGFDGETWNMNEFNSFEDISIENIINIVGTKKPILFIESEKGKLDYKFYSSLFINFKIIPVISCDKVVDSCKALNDYNYLNLNREAYGIIDNDFRTNDEIERYKQSKIFTLPYSEIENLILSPIIVDYICTKYDLNEKIERFKNAVIDMASRDKTGIIKDFLNKTYPKFQKSGHILNIDVENVDNEIDRINDENKTKFLYEFEQFISSLDSALNNRDYEEIIRSYPNKGFISCLSNLGISKDIYFSWVIHSIVEDEDFRNSIINCLFGNFFD